MTYRHPGLLCHSEGAARRAHDGDELAVLDFEGNAVESRGLDLFRAEDFAKVANSNHNCLYFNCLLFCLSFPA